jgi:hypothetical protein
VTELRERVLAVVEQLAIGGAEGFYASYVARRSQADDLGQVISVLVDLVAQGDLTERFEVVCPNPDCGRTAVTFAREEDVPVGRELECEKCGEPFIVTDSDVVVGYVPTQPFISRTLRKGSVTPLEDGPGLGAYEKKVTRSVPAGVRCST